MSSLAVLHVNTESGWRGGEAQWISDSRGESTSDNRRCDKSRGGGSPPPTVGGIGQGVRERVNRAMDNGARRTAGGE